jgi:predicted regulator of Ras-like GTPase activity (Roadblock/LC7/MglB family)
VLDETLAGVAAAIDGTRAVLLVGMDGMVVAGKGEDGDLPWDLVVASYADLVRRVASVHREAGIEKPAELVVVAADAALVLRTVTPEYALLAVLPPGGSLGRARFELKKAASRILPELDG